MVNSTNPWYGRVPPSANFISSSSVTCNSGLGLSDFKNVSLTVLISDPVSINHFVFTLFTINLLSILFPINLFNVSLSGMLVCLLALQRRHSQVKILLILFKLVSTFVVILFIPLLNSLGICLPLLLGLISIL